MHMVTAAFLTTSFVVAGISAWYLLKGRFPEHSKICFSMALGLISALAPLQILLGDLHGLNTLHHQPTKVAAMEGHWEGGAGAPLILFGLPDMEAEENHYEIAIPYLSSLILTHELEGKVPGLKDVRAGRAALCADRVLDLPPDGRDLGFVMLGVGLYSLWLRRKRRLYEDALVPRGSASR